MAHKWEFVSTENGYWILNAAKEYVQVIDEDGNWVGKYVTSHSASPSAS